MKSLSFLRVFNSACDVSCNRGIRTAAIFLGRTRGWRAPRKLNYEPGLRKREAVLSEDEDFPQENRGEEDLEDNLDIMNVDKAYDMNKLEERREREKIGRILTIKKFFRDPPQPQTLTCNERECIKYLHQKDPVQWDVKTLSESFPATPTTIKKILKVKVKLNAEEKKKIDEKVQKNWDLLAEGKLEAAPEVLDHLKKFVNRREVLLEQIKNANFYLPEVKEEIMWNNGEMSNILLHYEKAIEKLAQNQDLENVNLLTDGSVMSSSKIEEKSSLDVVQEKISQFKQSHNLKEKDSFTLNGMIKTYSKPVTVEELKRSLLMKAIKGKSLQLTERAIVESNLHVNTKPSFYTSNKVKLTASGEKTENMQDHSVESVQAKETFHIIKKQKNKLMDEDKLEKLKMYDEQKEFILPDSRTKFVYSNELGKALEKIGRKGKANLSSDEKAERKYLSDTATEENIIFSNTEGGLESEEQYFDNQVKDFENTQFWNKDQTNQWKILAENHKEPLGGPDTYGRGNIYSNDVYPERIQIPKNKRGSGLTFRVKDCYYDDDGEFLYRVPGMVK